MRKPNIFSPNIYYIDLFCGAGGVTTGIVRAGGKVIACINHDPLAIQSHKENHKNVLHFTEDIRHFNVHILARLVRNIRKKDTDAIICLWASLECIHFSKAAGGSSRDPDSRTLARHLYRYIDAIKPDYADIENVVEFLTWCRLRVACKKSYKNRSELKLVKSKKKAERQGHPYQMVPNKKYTAEYYNEWVNKITKDYQYDYEYKILNSADFGARTSRARYFGQFKKEHLPFTWPEATHAKDPSKLGDIGNTLKKWKPVRPALNLEDKGTSLFEGKMRVENTLKRIYGGLVKHVAGGKDPEYIIKYNSTNQKTGKSNPVDLNEPSPTIATQFGMNLVQPEFISKYYSSNGGKSSNTSSVNDIVGTIAARDGFAVVSPVFLQKYYGTRVTHDLDKPADTLTTKDRMAIVWLDKQYSGKTNHQGLDRPSGSIVANDKHCKVEAILVNNYSGGGQHGSVQDPHGSITTVPKSNVVSIHYLDNPQWSSKGSNVNRPCFTLIARMDKAPPSLVEAETSSEEFGIIIYKDDSEILKKIKLFMAAYGIVDIKMRMLHVYELLRIQGFGGRYKLAGNQTVQKKFIGNSVPPRLVKKKVKARQRVLREYFEKQKAA